MSYKKAKLTRLSDGQTVEGYFELDAKDKENFEKAINSPMIQTYIRAVRNATKGDEHYATMLLWSNVVLSLTANYEKLHVGYPNCSPLLEDYSYFPKAAIEEKEKELYASVYYSLKDYSFLMGTLEVEDLGTLPMYLNKHYTAKQREHVWETMKYQIVKDADAFKIVEFINSKTYANVELAFQIALSRGNDFVKLLFNTLKRIGYGFNLFVQGKSKDGMLLTLSLNDNTPYIEMMHQDDTITEKGTDFHNPYAYETDYFYDGFHTIDFFHFAWNGLCSR